MYERLIAWLGQTAFWILRFAVGIYLIFTMIERLVVPGQGRSVAAVYSLLGLAPVNQGNFYLGVTAFIGLMGLLLIASRQLVAVGLLVALLGLVNGVSEITMAVANRSLDAGTRYALLGLGARDVLLLATSGLAIAAFAGRYPRRWHWTPKAIFYRPEGAKGPAQEASATGVDSKSGENR